MPTKAKPDKLLYNDDGTISLGYDDVDITLRRPKTGELKSFLLELERIRSDATERYAPITGADADVDEIRKRAVEDLDVLAPWIALTVETLATNGARLPDDPEEWPVWLTNGDNVAGFIKHWRSNPLGRGGK